MEVEINFAGIRQHGAVLEETGRRIADLKDILSLWYNEEKGVFSPNADQVYKMIQQADRLERSVKKRMVFLDDLVCDFQALKDENARKLDWCEQMLLSAEWQGKNG